MNWGDGYLRGNHSPLAAAHLGIPERVRRVSVVARGELHFYPSGTLPGQDPARSNQQRADWLVTLSGGPGPQAD